MFAPASKAAFTVGAFVAPNEQYPQNSSSLLREAPRGAYVTVGTERGFISAGIAARIDLLVLTDIDLAVVQFNRINIALLKVAGSRENYVSLRLEAPSSKWALAAKDPLMTPEERKLLRNPDAWKWWVESVRGREGKNALFFESFHRPPSAAGVDEAFHSANYLFYDDQFARVSGMAKADRIHVLPVDYRDLRQIEKISK